MIITSFLCSEINIILILLETVKINNGMNDDQQRIYLDYYKKCGYDEEAQLHFIERNKYRQSLVTNLESGFQELDDQQTVKLSNGLWQIIIAQGHSPSHACLFSEENNVFICGDVLLPRITPNVSVNPAYPDGNPLKDWLDSLENIKQKIPDDVLVLPSHGYPYKGAHLRIETILKNHHDKLNKIANYEHHITINLIKSQNLKNTITINLIKSR